MSTETIRLIRDGEKGYEDGGRGKLYTSHCIVTTRMTPALKWAVMRAILMFHSLWGTNSQGGVYGLQLFEEKGELKWIWTKVPLLTSLTVRSNQLTNKYPCIFPYTCWEWPLQPLIICLLCAENRQVLGYLESVKTPKILLLSILVWS